MSTLKVNSIEPANAGSEDYFLVRSWVNFDSSGTAVIRQSGNVSSITDAGGDYNYITMASAAPNTDYSSVCTNGAGRHMNIHTSYSKTTTVCQFYSGSGDGGSFAFGDENNVIIVW